MSFVKCRLSDTHTLSQTLDNYYRTDAIPAMKIEKKEHLNGEYIFFDQRRWI